jgi:hypothetical protein
VLLVDINTEGVIAEMRAYELVGLHINCPLVLLNVTKKEWNVSINFNL